MLRKKSEKPPLVAALLEPDLLSLERGARSGAGVRVALPVRPERVVALALLGVGQDGVGLVDLLEALRGALVDVRVVLAGELPVGRLDGLVVGGLRHAENLVVVLVFHGFGK